MIAETCKTLFYLARDMDAVEVQRIGPGSAAGFSSSCPGREGPNEDAALFCPVGAGHCVLVVADGFGGHAAGARASEIAVRAIEQCVCEHDSAENNMRSAIVDGFEKANQTIIDLGIGAATTLAVVDIEGRQVRSYHVGDSAIFLVGQRGRIKMRSVSHSPVGYAVESGLIDEKEAMNHEERHIVSNMVGSPDMRIEIGPSLELAARDTVLLGSDGLTDNVGFEELVEIIRKGPLDKSLGELVDRARTRMENPGPDIPSKPDDLTAIAFRLVSAS